jgi:hypothetical protein
VGEGYVEQAVEVAEKHCLLEEEQKQVWEKWGVEPWAPRVGPWCALPWMAALEAQLEGGEQPTELQGGRVRLAPARGTDDQGEVGAGEGEDESPGAETGTVQELEVDVHLTT